MSPAASAQLARLTHARPTFPLAWLSSASYGHWSKSLSHASVRLFLRYSSHIDWKRSTWRRDHLHPKSRRRPPSIVNQRVRAQSALTCAVTLICDTENCALSWSCALWHISMTHRTVRRSTPHWLRPPGISCFLGYATVRFVLMNVTFYYY